MILVLLAVKYLKEEPAHAKFACTNIMVEEEESEREERKTSIRFLICATLLFTASWVLPSPTIVVVSLVSTTLDANPRTSFPALSKERPTSSLITVPVKPIEKTHSYQHQETKRGWKKHIHCQKDMKILNFQTSSQDCNIIKVLALAFSKSRGLKCCNLK